MARDHNSETVEVTLEIDVDTPVDEYAISEDISRVVDELAGYDNAIISDIDTGEVQPNYGTLGES